MYLYILETKNVAFQFYCADAYSVIQTHTETLFGIRDIELLDQKTLLILCIHYLYDEKFKKFCELFHSSCEEGWFEERLQDTYEKYNEEVNMFILYPHAIPQFPLQDKEVESFLNGLPEWCGEKLEDIMNDISDDIWGLLPQLQFYMYYKAYRYLHRTDDSFSILDCFLPNNENEIHIAIPRNAGQALREQEYRYGTVGE